MISTSSVGSKLSLESSYLLTPEGSQFKVISVLFTNKSNSDEIIDIDVNWLDENNELISTPIVCSLSKRETLEVSCKLFIDVGQKLEFKRLNGTDDNLYVTISYAR